MRQARRRVNESPSLRATVGETLVVDSRQSLVWVWIGYDNACDSVCQKGSSTEDPGDSQTDSCGLRGGSMSVVPKRDIYISGVEALTDRFTARLATSHLLSLAEYRNARRIGVYLSMPTGELSTTGIVQDALTHGKEVYIPYIYNVEPPVLQQKTSVMDMLLLESMEEFEALEPDKWGIPSLQRDQALRKKNCFGGRGLTFPAEPQPTTTHEAEQGLDLIVMPGMAFDLEFRRLGHGKGFYDHFLTRYSGKETTVTPKMPFLGKRSCVRTHTDE